MRKYSETALKALAEGRDTVTEEGMEILLKKTDRTVEGNADPYEAAYKNPDAPGQPAGKPASPEEAVAGIRDRFGCHNYNLNGREIYTEYESLCVEGRRVGLWRYYLRRRDESPRPCLFYIHGGGWVAGSVYTVENPCRLIAELADAVVFNIDYSLAPEAKYPAAFNELWEALRHIYANADTYGIDRGRILAAGDSAGGNLTAALALRDRDEGTRMFAGQFMLYPVTDAGKKNGKEGPDEMAGFYVSDLSQIRDPYVSPALAEDLTGLAPAVIATAEYDDLRIQGESYGRQLADAGVPVTVMRYVGCYHAFLDRLGYVPQSEDVCREIAARLRAL